jgi:hypothetical protein
VAFAIICVQLQTFGAEPDIMPRGVPPPNCSIMSGKNHHHSGISLEIEIVKLSQIPNRQDTRFLGTQRSPSCLTAFTAINNRKIVLTLLLI